MSADDSYAVLPLVELSEEQQERLQEEIWDIRKNGESMEDLAVHLLPFQPQCKAKSIQQLLELALHKPDDEASGGKFLADVFGLSQSDLDDIHHCCFFAVDERGAASLTDDAEEAFNVLAVHIESISLRYFYANEIFQPWNEDDEAVSYLKNNPAQDSSVARLKLLKASQRCAESEVEASEGSVPWDQYASFHCNVADAEAVLTRTEGKDAEALDEVRLVRLTAIRAELQPAALTMRAAEVQHAPDMYSARKHTKILAAWLVPFVTEGRTLH
ncbi:hypothetical protein OC834_001706 [Tilletia horrida]|uniref:Uncharacterized protein n=1 Tax=Tilletia horrida TaxID=155126 RepID=A0AAN6GF88_9BASI|nr:hypothetical protein OC834_001706 [Tilletia horrida]KAK0536114.1 hypothetical protein OC835_002128 [Tilletia horrida]KAK0537350.1 hypothetical protein OC842_001658 [Tilletia horrida]KAK0545746.1 hypothetical protein OC844_007316 [Tilletia horrida]